MTAVNNFHFFLFTCSLKDHLLSSPACQNGCVIQKGSKSLDPVLEKLCTGEKDGSVTQDGIVSCEYCK